MFQGVMQVTGDSESSPPAMHWVPTAPGMGQYWSRPGGWEPCLDPLSIIGHWYFGHRASERLYCSLNFSIHSEL